MLSFGIEYERAFSAAFWSARLFAGSPPPSFAATMIARASFENNLPRLASAAPFLCLIEDHLLCPDMGSDGSAGVVVVLARQQSCDLVAGRPLDRLSGCVHDTFPGLGVPDDGRRVPVTGEGRKGIADGAGRKACQ